MQKKGQGLTGKFQKRYFRIMLQGKVLVYYKAKPGSLYDKPKGIFEMALVQNIEVKEKKKLQFKIYYLYAEGKRSVKFKVS